MCGVRLSSKKTTLFALSVTLGFALVFATWVVTTPKWAFSVSTDKSTYELGENVNITVIIRNLGFITHSFKSRVSDLVVVSIDYQHISSAMIQVWYNPFHYNVTEFSVMPSQSLERSFIWNQSNIHLEEEEAEPGKYYIYAFVPRADSTAPLRRDNLFWAWTSMNITSSEP